MKNKLNILLIILCSAFFISGLIWSIAEPDTDFSSSERRHLSKLPQLDIGSFVDGSFSRDFDTYVTEQFPMRETFRSIYSNFSYSVLAKLDVNGIYVHNEHAAKLDPSLNEESLNWAIDRINFICDKYAPDNMCYLCVIPDKNYYLTKDSIYPYLDSDYFTKQLANATKTNYIDISKALSYDCYYKSDLHWSQASILPVAQLLASKLNVTISQNFDKHTLDNDFYGVYFGQSALNLPPDEIVYLTNNVIDSLRVTCFDSGKAENMDVYNMDKAFGRDPYEMFLNGAKSLITIDNPLSNSNRHLILFRDSFSSSIAPILATGYSKITLIDIRYISPGILDRFVDFKNADIMFLYSQQVLNSAIDNFLK